MEQDERGSRDANGRCSRLNRQTGISQWVTRVPSVVNVDSITACNSTIFFLLPLRTHFEQARRKASGKGDRCSAKVKKVLQYLRVILRRARKRKTLARH